MKPDKTLKVAKNILSTLNDDKDIVEDFTKILGSLRQKLMVQGFREVEVLQICLAVVNNLCDKI